MKVVKRLLFGFFAWTIFISAVSALEWNGDSSGSGTWDVNCGDTSSTYCYNSSGLRLTLYKISDDKKSATKKGHSHDFWSPDNPTTYLSYTYFTTTSLDVVNDKIRGNVLRSQSNFSIGELGYGVTALTDRVTYIPSWPYDLLTNNANFRAWLDDTENNPIFKKTNSYNKLKNVFGLTDTQKNDIISNFQKYYLVVEPLFALWKGSGAARPSGFTATNGINGSGASYAGTVFDMAVFSPYTSAVMKHAKALYNGTNVGDFVKSGGDILVPVGASFNENSIKGRTAIGMSVYKLEDVITEKTCYDECGTNPTLKCAEGYCEGKSVGSNRTDTYKTTCLSSQCGKARPTVTTANTCTHSSTVAGHDSCGTANYTPVSEQFKKRLRTNSEYFSIDCTTTYNVRYANDLPTTLVPGTGGFNYSATAFGNKTCKLEFLNSLFEYDYAGKLRSSASRTNLLNKLNAYNSMNASHGNSNGYYNVPDTTAYIQIGNTASTRIRKDLVLSSKDNDTKFTNSSQSNLNLYGNSSPTTAKYYPTKTYTNDYSHYLNLPQYCYSLRDFRSYNPILASGTTQKCDKAYDLIAYGYYSKTTEPKVKVDAYIANSEGCLNDQNHCYYNNGEAEADCYIGYKKISGNRYEITYGVTNRKGISISANFNGAGINRTFSGTNPIYTETVTKTVSGTAEINGSISYTVNGTIVRKSCPTKIQSTASTCKEQGFKPTAYDEIRKWCQKNWTNANSSYEDCYNSCTNPNLSCKKYKCESKAEIENWCNNSSNRALAGYESKESCINDCYSCDDTEKKYLYRPVSLGKNSDSTNPYNAFPQRQAGSNWIGYEERYTKDDDFTSSPIYIIKLNKNNIETIRNDYDENKYASFTQADKENSSNVYYKSEFISSHSEIFTKLCGDRTKGCGS